jgi:signal transduction histidine kinase
MRPEETLEQISAEELAQLDLLAQDEPEAIRWLAAHMGVASYEAGDAVLRKGEPVRHFAIVLEGEIHISRPEDQQASVMIRRKGQPMGLLPFSRLKVSPGNAVALLPTRLAAMDGVHLRELVYRAPNLAQRLVQEMTDRTREFTQLSERGNKMLALGKLAAGLAHELNNPASAAVRASVRLREALLARRREAVPASVLVVVNELNAGLEACGRGGAALDAIDRADREWEFEQWLAARGLAEQYAAPLVDAGVTPAELERFPAEVLRGALPVLVVDYEILCLTEELQDTSRRISDMVEAVKSYSYMDTTAVGDVDIEKGIDTTLRMYGYRVTPGLEVLREFAGNLPRIRANGSELNQVWGNLIDNALDALECSAGREKRLEIRTRCEVHGILVEIADSGAGIPPELQGRVFEPFFTTKPMGEGTGLGLDIVQRIVRGHKGSIRLESKPGRTSFQVRLPVAPE